MQSIIAGRPVGRPAALMCRPLAAEAARDGQGSPKSTTPAAEIIILWLVRRRAGAGDVSRLVRESSISEMIDNERGAREWLLDVNSSITTTSDGCEGNFLKKFSSRDETKILSRAPSAAANFNSIISAPASANFISLPRHARPSSLMEPNLYRAKGEQFG